MSGFHAIGKAGGAEPELNRSAGTPPPARALGLNLWLVEDQAMKGLLLWAIGIPLPVIIGLYLFHVL